MKRALATLLAAAAMLPLCAQALPPDDSAAYIVNRYLMLLNTAALPADSMLVMHTVVTYSDSDDTSTVSRWFRPPLMHRVEVRDGGRLNAALCTNGTSRFRRYDKSNEWWTDVGKEDFWRLLAPYDFRGPLAQWRASGATLTYRGRSTVKGTSLQVVQVEAPGQYGRYYFFDPASSLLTLIIETDEMDPDHAVAPQARIDYKVVLEYQPLGTSLLTSLESFMRDGVLTTLRTTYRLEAPNSLIFNQD